MINKKEIATKRLSVVISIYNADDFLKRTVDSVLLQNQQNVEVILVDDGSKDMSGIICDKYAEEFSNVKVIHKKNGGISSTRNAGIKAAAGEYISFLDADDFFDNNSYQKILEVIEKEAPDCIEFGWKYINENKEITYNLNKVEKNKLLSQDIINNVILPPLLNLTGDKESFIYDFVWNKIYKRQILEEYNILFDESRRTWEDRPFLVQYLKCCKSFYSMDKCFYNYVNVPNSLSQRYDLQFFDIILQNYRQYVEWFGNQYDFNIQYVNNHWCHSIENMIFRSLKEEKQKEIIRQNIFRILKDKQVIKWYKNRKPENEQEIKTSQLVVAGEVEAVVKVYEHIVKKQKKKEKWNQFKAKAYAVRKVFES